MAMSFWSFLICLRRLRSTYPLSPVLFLMLFLLMGCATPAPRSEIMVQRFSTQAYYLDKKTNKGQQFTLDVIAKKNQKLRFDAKVILGLHIATAVIVQDQVQVALHPERKYYSGVANPQTLQRTLGIPLYPLIFHAMLYRQAFKGSGWSCHSVQNKVQSCAQNSSGMEIRWEDQEEVTLVKASARNFEFQWRIFPAETVAEKVNYFEIKVPDSYSKMIL